MGPIKPNEQSPLYFQRKKAETILETMAKYPLTVVTAPTGYGKTVLTKNFIAARKKKVCWLVLNRGDNSLKYFWGKLLRELKKSDEALADSFALHGFPSTAEQLAGFFDLFLKSKFAAQERYIILDNYQYINNPHIHDFIRFIAQEQVEGMHIFLLTRATVPYRFLECSVDKIMGVVRAPDFEFSADEIQSFFDFNGCEITREQAEIIHRYSQGWITAIYLMLLHYQQSGQICIPNNLKSLVEGTMYTRYNDEIRSFLKKLSVMETYTAEAATYITENKNAAHLLDELIYQNSFIRYNQKLRVYLMHPVFRAFLHQKLMSENREEFAHLNQRVGEYMLHHESRVRGLEWLYRAGDNDGILRFLRDKPFKVWKEIESAELIRYFTTLTEELKLTHYATYLRFILFLAADNRLRLAQTLVREATELYQESWLSRNDVDRRLRGEIYTVESLCYSFQPRKSVGFLRKAAALLPDGSEIAGRDAMSAVECISLLTVAHEESGNLQGTVELSEEISQTLFRLTGAYGYGGTEFCRAEYHWWRGELKEAEELFYTALQKAQSQDHLPVALRCVCFLIRKLMFNGSYEKIQSLMRLHGKLLAEEKNDDFVQLCDGFIHSVNTVLGSGSTLAEWEQPEESSEEDIARKEPVWKQLAAADHAVLLQNWPEVLRLCRKIKPYFTQHNKILGLIYTNIFEAIATTRLYVADYGKAYLRAALELALPDRLVMPFVINCETTTELLQSIKEDTPADSAFIDEILALSRLYRKGLQALRKDLNPCEEQVEFTPREKEMISYLINCQSNKEIAYNMGVKIGTVKKMMYNIFQKLEVNCRAGAIKKIMDSDLDIS